MKEKYLLSTKIRFDWGRQYLIIWYLYFHIQHFFLLHF